MGKGSPGGVFNGNHNKRNKGDSALVARLYQQIGQLKVEEIFFGKGPVYEPGAAAGDGDP